MPDAASPLARAIDRLREGLARHDQARSDEQLRDGLIQRFEFTYELSHRSLRRALRAGSAVPEEIDAMSFADLIRAGTAQGLLATGWPAWRGFREMRARSSHTYDEQIALAVIAIIPAFLQEAAFLCRQLDRPPA